MSMKVPGSCIILYEIFKNSFLTNCWLSLILCLLCAYNCKDAGRWPGSSIQWLHMSSFQTRKQPSPPRIWCCLEILPYFLNPFLSLSCPPTTSHFQGCEAPDHPITALLVQSSLAVHLCAAISIVQVYFLPNRLVYNYSRTFLSYSSRLLLY